MPSPGKRRATICRPPEASGLNFARIPERTNITSFRGPPGSRKGRRGSTWTSRHGIASSRSARRGSSPAETNVSRSDTTCPGAFVRRVANAVSPRGRMRLHTQRRNRTYTLRIIADTYRKLSANSRPAESVAGFSCRPCLQLRAPLSGARGQGNRSFVKAVAIVAQLVRASVCGTEGRGFKSPRSPHFFNFGSPDSLLK